MKHSWTLILFFLIVQNSVSAQNYKPVSEDKSNLFLTKDGQTKDFFNSNGAYVRSDFDSLVSSGSTIIYYPYQTARYEDVSEWGCQYLVHHNWLGSKVIYNEAQELTTFYYDQVEFDQGTSSYNYFGEKNLPVFHNLDIGGKWYIDFFENIYAEVISIEETEWEGLEDTIKTIRVTDIDDRYEWSEEFIRISKNHGLVSFPNLQFYPYQWINCELKGMENPKLGVHEPTAREMFHMEAGDEYTAEYRIEYHDGLLIYFFQKLKCLSILTDQGNNVSRNVQIDIYQYGNSAWHKTTTFETQDIDYTSKLPLGKSNQLLSPYTDPQNSSLVLFDSLEYKYNLQLGEIQESNCINQWVDHCNNYFSYNGAFDTYYDCSGGFTKYFYYLPRYIKNGDAELGEDVNFDSLLTTSQISWKNEVLFTPNPSNGTFTFETQNNEEFKFFKAVNVMGKEFFVKSTIYNKKIELIIDVSSGVYFIYGIDQKNQLIGLGKIILH